jgi:hypothetical protein
MFSDTFLFANDRQQALRHEVSQSRLVIQTNESSLRKRLATVASVVRSARPGVDVAQGSVFTATH